MSGPTDGASRAEEGLRAMDDQLLDALVVGLEPVRRAPALRIRFLAAVGVAGAVFLAAIGVGGMRGDLAHEILRNPNFALSLIGLVGLAAGGLLAALAASSPGRDGLERRAQWWAVGSLATAILACLVAAVSVGFESESTLAADWMCLQQSLKLSALPVLATLAAVMMGWVVHPRQAALGALAGGAALGALMVHLACGASGAVHLLGGHLSVPFLAVAVLGYPVAHAFERWGR